MSFTSVSSFQSTNIRNNLKSLPEVVVLLSGQPFTKTTYNGYNVVMFRNTGISNVSINNPNNLTLNFAVVGGGSAGGWSIPVNGVNYSAGYNSCGGGGGGKYYVFKQRIF